MRGYCLLGRESRIRSRSRPSGEQFGGGLVVKVSLEGIAKVCKDGTALLSQCCHRGPDALVPLPAGFTAGPLRDPAVDDHEADGLHAVRITPEGQLFASDEHQPEVALGSLSNQQGNDLNALLEDWDTLPAISEEPICCDGFGYGIAYRGRTLSWFQGQENVPERLREIAFLVWSAENDLRPD